MIPMITAIDNDIWATSLKGKIGYARLMEGIASYKHNQKPALFAVFIGEDIPLFNCAVIKDADTLKMWHIGETPGFPVEESLP